MLLFYLHPGSGFHTTDNSGIRIPPTACAARKRIVLTMKNKTLSPSDYPERIPEEHSAVFI